MISFLEWPLILFFFLPPPTKHILAKGWIFMHAVAEICRYGNGNHFKRGIKQGGGGGGVVLQPNSNTGNL